MSLYHHAALGLAATLAAATPANAATIVQNFAGPGPENVVKFDPTLGTLTAITANVTGGFARYLVTLNGPLNASTSYAATAYFGIYLGPLTIDGNVQNAGTVTFINGEATLDLPVVPYVRNIAVPNNPMTAAYQALIGVGTTFASVTGDPPYSLSFGNLQGRGVSDVSSTGRTAIWNLVYEYSPFVVPEPATWAMMLLGFGMTGAALRRRRHVLVVRYG